LPGCARATVATIAPQDAAGSTVLAGARRAVGAITDQRAPQQDVGGDVDDVKDRLLESFEG